MQTLKAVAVLASLLVGACGEVQDRGPGDLNSTIDAGGGGAGRAAACLDLGTSAANQSVTLYLDGDAAKPYQAHCSADLKTYIPLDGTNTSRYPSGGCATLPTSDTAAVITTWQMVHFDPANHMVDTGDYAFATSTGTTHEESDNGTRKHDYAAIPFASGRWCLQDPDQIVATIDLTGTHFAIASAQAWVAEGFNAMATPTINAQRTKATISVIGFPVGTTPCAANSDYYTEHGGSCLALDYVP